MELSSKSKTIKKRYKKKKINLPNGVLKPLIKPNACDGVSNWMRMQKIIDSVKEKKPKKESERMLNLANLTLKDYMPLFKQQNAVHKKSLSTNSSTESGQLTAKNDQNKFSEKCLNGTEESRMCKKNGIQSHKFNFNGSINNSPEKNGVIETKKNKFGEKILTKAVAMDCEMVGTGPKGEESIIARVSIVNAYGVCLYDEFVKPREKVTDFRTKVSGVRPSDLKKGKDLFEVQKDVLKIVEGRILVGHSIKHDLDVLFMSHPRHLIRDTAFYKPFRDLCGGRTPSLKKLASKILGCDIQSGEHSSVEDAQATMLLYLRQRREWEAQVEDAQAAMLLYLRQKKEWEKAVRMQRRRKPKNITNEPNL